MFQRVIVSLVLTSHLIIKEGGLTKPTIGLLTIGTGFAGLVTSRVDFSLGTLTLRSFDVIGVRRQQGHFLRRAPGTISGSLGSEVSFLGTRILSRSGRVAFRENSGTSRERHGLGWYRPTQQVFDAVIETVLELLTGPLRTAIRLFLVYSQNFRDSRKTNTS